LSALYLEQKLFSALGQLLTKAQEITKSCHSFARLLTGNGAEMSVDKCMYAVAQTVWSTDGIIWSSDLIP